MMRQGKNPAARIFVDADDAPQADFAVLWRQPSGFFSRQPSLRAAFAAGAGVDWLVGDQELPAQLAVHRIEDAGMARQMAAYCCHEVLRLHYGHAQYEAQQREGNWNELDYRDPASRTVGVFGLGVLGSVIAQSLAGFGFSVRGFARTRKSIAGVQCFSEADGVERFIEACDVMVVAAPLTPQTRDFFNAKRLAGLAQGAWLINIARGELVVDEDLLAALDSGRLAGATLDVFRTEPLPAEHRFWKHPSVRITPHVAAITVIDTSARQVAQRIRAILAGEQAGGLVDRSRAY